MKVNSTTISPADVKVIRWRGSQHPTFQTITNLMQAEGLRPYAWALGPNTRQAVRSHAHGKVLYCIEGVVEMILPDLNQRIILRPGDRMDIPRGIRYAAMIGPNGVRSVEGEQKTLLS